MSRLKINLKPEVLDISILEAIFGNLHTFKHQYDSMIRFPVIPRGKQVLLYSGSTFDSALAQAAKYNLPLYAGFRYWKQNNRWNYQACAFCTERGKVVELNKGLNWKQQQAVKYTGIEVPQFMWQDKKFTHEFQNQSFIQKYSPLALFDLDLPEVIIEEMTDEDGRPTD